MKKAILAVMILAGTLFALKNAEAAYLTDLLKDKGIDAEVSASIDFYDKYVWRGILLDDDAVLQPGVTITIGGFEAGFWGSWDLESEDGLASDEVDGWIGYSFDLGFIDPELEIIGVSFGNTWYAFPETDGSAEELYLTVSADTFLSPYFSWYHDYGDESDGSADGNYYAFGIGHSFDVAADYGITFDTGFEVGLNDEAFIVGEGGYYLFTAGLSVPLSDNVTFTPNVGYSVPFGDLEDSNDGNYNDEFYGGAGLAFAF